MKQPNILLTIIGAFLVIMIIATGGCGSNSDGKTDVEKTSLATDKLKSLP